MTRNSVTACSFPMDMATLAAGPHCKEPTVIRLVDAWASYGRDDVLRGLTTHFDRGETFALLGPNGAGKSSLLRVLTGNLPLNSGEVSYFPQGIELVPQSVALYPFMTARENCIALAVMNGLPRSCAKERAPGALKLVGCSHVAGVRADRLSGGFRRRVDMAVALMHRPPLLALDEPSAGLDVSGKDALTGILTDLKSNGIGTIVVTHDFEFAERIADRVGLLLEGRLLVDAPLGEALALAFGPGRLIEVTLASIPDAGQRSLLASVGFSPWGETLWATKQCLSSEAIEGLLARLRAAGLAEREIRIRAPSLEDLYRALIQDVGDR